MQEGIGTHPLWHFPVVGNVHSDTILVTWLVMGITLLAVGILAASHPRTSLTKRYTLLELIVTTLGDLATGILGKNGRPFVPFIIAIFLFILLLNEIGLFPIPGLRSPTADINTTAALALTTFLLIQVVGIKNKGFIGYYKHLFAADPWWLGILMSPINIIDELARPITLAMRLFGNIFAGEVLMLVVLVVIGANLSIGFLPVSKIATAFPLFVTLFNMAIGLIQALVFTLLAIAYLIIPTAETEH